MCRELLGSLAEQQVLHVKQPLGDTAMHLAARRKDANLMKTLIEAGAQVVLLNPACPIDILNIFLSRLILRTVKAKL